MNFDVFGPVVDLEPWISRLSLCWPNELSIIVSNIAKLSSIPDEFRYVPKVAGLTEENIHDRNSSVVSSI